ncbi:MAG: glycosyltransferase family 4 protein [Vicinamibacterales bacterium]
MPGDLINAMPNTLRLAYVLKRFPRLSETFVLHELLALERLGAQLTVFAMGKPDEMTTHPALSRLRAEVCYVPKNGNARLDAQARWVAEAATERGVQHLHAHFATGATALAWRVHDHTGLPFSFTAHAKDIFHETVDHDWLRRAILASTFAVTVSDFNCRYLAAACGREVLQKVRRLYNGIDLEQFPFAGSEGRSPRSVLGVGRFVAKKGFDTLIDAAALLRRRGTPIQVTLIGSGEMAAALRQQVRDLRLERDVTFTGALPQNCVTAHMQTHAIMAAPCVIGADGNRDGLPTVLLEAMASGLPAVSTDVTGIPEMICDGVSGRIVPQRDIVALAEALHDLVEDLGARERFASAARRVVTEEFHLETNVGRLRSWFETSASGGDVGGTATKVRLNVAHVCADLGIAVLGSKGAAVHVRELTAGLASEGHDVTVVAACLGEGDRAELRADAIEVETHERGDVPRDARAREWAASRANRRFRTAIETRHMSCAFDVVYERYSLWSYAGASFARRAGLPFILEVNSPLHDEQRIHRTLCWDDRAARVGRFVFEAATRIVVVSEEVGVWVRRWVSDPDKVIVVPNGVDLGRYTSSPSFDAGQPFVVGFVGSLKPWHGVDVLLEAIHRLSADVPDVRALIVGDGPERTRLEAFARNLGIADRVNFVGAMPKSQVPRAMSAMAVATAPYPELAGFYFSPLKVFEYMAAGRAIVASAIGQVRQVIADGETGRLCVPGDAGDLARILLDLARDPAQRQRLGLAARKEAFARHGWAARVRLIFDGVVPAREAACLAG